MNTRNNTTPSPMTLEVIATNSDVTPLEILLAVTHFEGIRYTFTEDCPLVSHKDQTRLLMNVNARIDEALAAIERIDGKALIPAYFAAVLLGTHGYEPEPVHLRYFTRPVWELHVRDPRELVKLVEALESAADVLEEDPCLDPTDIHSGCIDAAVPYDAYDQYVSGTEPLDLFPEHAFAARARA